MRQAPRSAVLDKDLMEITDRLLSPKMMRPDGPEMPADQVLPPGTLMRPAGDGLPASFRCRRRKVVWDRGARWKTRQESIAIPAPPAPLPPDSGASEEPVA